MDHDAIKQIQDRNIKVETDKAWETSKTRRGVIAGATYPCGRSVYVGTWWAFAVAQCPDPCFGLCALNPVFI